MIATVRHRRLIFFSNMNGNGTGNCAQAHVQVDHPLVLCRVRPIKILLCESVDRVRRRALARSYKQQ